MNAKTKTTAVLAALIVACGSSDSSPATEEPTADSFAPGGTVNLTETFRDALIAAPGGGTGVTWEISGAVPQAAYDAGLSLSSDGRLTLPGCTYATTYGYTFPLTVGLLARSGSTVLLSIALAVDERFVSASADCYIPAGETTCRDPNAGGIVFEAGTATQFYSRVQTSCQSIWAPALPVGACPAGNPAFAFCQ